MTKKLKPVNVGERGLEMFLGALEVACMRAVWARCGTSKKIWQHVRDNYTTVKTDEIAYTSVTSTIYRLWSQGYLTRVGDRNAGFSYTPVHATEAAFVNENIRVTVNALLENYPREAGQVIIEHLRANVATARKLSGETIQ